MNNIKLKGRKESGKLEGTSRKGSEINQEPNSIRKHTHTHKNRRMLGKIGRALLTLG